MKKQFMIWGVITFGVFVYIFGNPMSNEAMAVVVGALCGITASIPVSLALFIAASRNWGHGELAREEPPNHIPRVYAAQPPIVVISPQQFNPSITFALQPNPHYVPTQWPSLGVPREFKIAGDD